MAMQEKLCNLQIHVNAGQQTFFLNQKIMSSYSGTMKNEMNLKKTQMRNSRIEIKDFPGGSHGFELVSRFCYNNGRISITPSNVALLHCSAIFLEMTEDFKPLNLLQQTETFLEGLFYWSWSDILISLKSCDSFISIAEASGLLHKLISSLLTKISQKSDMNFTVSPSPSSSSSSPETPVNGFGFGSSARTTPESNSSTSATTPGKAWWFDDLTILPPKIIDKIIQTMGCYGTDNNSPLITKFLLHYLKTAFQTRSGNGYSGIAETAVCGVVSMGRTAFSCRGLFWVQRVVSGFGVSKGCRGGLERLIGEMLDKATLDDLLVCGNHSRKSCVGGEAYDVDLVLRLIKAFVGSDEEVTVQRMKRVGRLVDKYMGEISPDHNLKVSKFLAVAESLPDCARDCFDGVYRAVDIYIESHPSIPFEERSNLCRCLNYEKLTLEACRDLAKNPRIPPDIAVQALISQKPKVPSKIVTGEESPVHFQTLQTYIDPVSDNEKFPEFAEKDELKMNLQKMQWRVLELEKVCMEMKNQMSTMANNNSFMGVPVLNK